MSVYCNFATWRFRNMDGSAAERHAFVRALVQGSIDIARDTGMVDFLMIEAEPDLLMSVSSFESLEDAEAASPFALTRLSDEFGQHLDVLSRITGRAYDLPYHPGANRAAVQQWRNAGGGMHVSVATWHLDPIVRPPDELEALLADIWAAGGSILLEPGLLDRMIVRMTDDTIASLHLYPDASAVGANHEAVAVTRALMDGKITFLEERHGQAHDVLSLLDGHR